MKGDKLNVQRGAIEQIKLLNEWEPNRKFTQTELLGVTGNTINALVRRGVLEVVEDSPLKKYGLEYYQWTGKEIE